MKGMRHHFGHWLLRDETKTQRGVVSFETGGPEKWSPPVPYAVEMRGTDVHRVLLKLKRERGGELGLS